MAAAAAAVAVVVVVVVDDGDDEASNLCVKTRWSSQFIFVHGLFMILVIMP